MKLLRCHPFEEQGQIIHSLCLNWPSSDMTIRNVLNSLYFNNGSTSEDHMKQAAELARYFEATMCVMNILRDSHPLTTDSCKISDLLEILADYLPQHVPKVRI